MLNYKEKTTLPLEEGHCVISNVCLMRSSAALVYNCKQARIVLAGTSFATTKALAFQNYSKRVNGSLLTFTTSAA